MVVNRGNLPWMNWIPSFYEDYCLTILLYDQFAFCIVTLKEFNFGVTVYKGVIPPWIKWHPSFYNDYFLNFLQVKVSVLENWVKKYSTLRFPIIVGPSPMNEMNTILVRRLQSNYTAVLPTRFVKRDFTRIQFLGSITGGRFIQNIISVRISPQ